MGLKEDIDALYKTKQQALESGLSSAGYPIAGIPTITARNKAMDMTIADLMERRIKLKHENWLQKQKELKNLARLMGFERLAQALGGIGGQLVDLYSQWKQSRKYDYGIKPEERTTAREWTDWLKYQESVLNAPLNIDEETAKQFYEFANKPLPFGPEGESMNK